ncbi:MAG: tripartite tricarboxylate transporter TctB family protein [Bacteroidales bacterium]|nr:tripartite tricarboxylate transporter TctB family protein [Bacteroidales bacterium]
MNHKRLVSFAFPILSILLVVLYFLGTKDLVSPHITFLLVLPILIGVLIASFLVLLAEFKKTKAEENISRDDKINTKGLKKGILLFFTITIYIMLFDFLGFPLVSFLFTAFLMTYLGVKLHYSLLFSLIFVTIISLFFSNLLYIPLPMGLLKPVLTM